MRSWIFGLVWFNGFFWKLVVNFHDDVYENVGCINERIRIFGITIEIWSWRISNWLEKEQLIESQLALRQSLTLIGEEIDLLMLIERLKRMAGWSEEKSLFKEKFGILF